MLFVGTSRAGRFGELFAIETGASGRALTIAWSLEVDAHVTAIALEGSRLYLASSSNASELIIVDTDLRQVVGTFDLEGTADPKLIELVEPGVVLVGRRRSRGPEFYRLDVRDPANVVVLEAVEDPRGAVAAKPEALALYHHKGRLVGRVDRTTARAHLHYLAVTDPNAEIQVVEERIPVVFADVNGDGIYRLGCVGDSNTVAVPMVPRWCELLRDMIDDPDFEIVNVAVSGATVVIPNRWFDSDATLQMEKVLQVQPDAVVLAFGTNDAFQGRTSAEIHAAYLDQEATAAAAGIGYFVATTPPIGGCVAPSCMPSNALLRASFPGRFVEFFDGFTPEYFRADGYHVNELGQVLRAERAFATFANPAVYHVP